MNNISIKYSFLMQKGSNCELCGSLIHNTENCWNNGKLYCKTEKMYKENCECEICNNDKSCRFCETKIKVFKFDGFCSTQLCPICNEHMFYSKLYGTNKCIWNHDKPPCKFCGLPVSVRGNSMCLNNHREFINDPICKKCGLPQVISHKHDGTKCAKCDTLLNEGKCIYKCVNGGAICVHCKCEAIWNGRCGSCGKTQSGKMTKRAVK